MVAGYRLATPGMHYPAQSQHTKAAVVWIHRNIAGYGGDPQKIFLSGYSVGATLLADVSFDRGRGTVDSPLSSAVLQMIRQPKPDDG